MKVMSVDLKVINNYDYVITGLLALQRLGLCLFNFMISSVGYNKVQ